MPGGEGGDLLDSTQVWWDLNNDGEVESVPDAGYIVEGSNVDGQLEIQNDTVEVGWPLEENYGQDQDENNNMINTEQIFLQKMSSNTSAARDLPIFQYYPEGGSWHLVIRNLS